METFKFKINTFVYSARKTMAEIIDICRGKAINGHSVTLEILGEHGWVHMGKYTYDPESPRKWSYAEYKDGPTCSGETPCCVASPAPLAFKHV